jgi:hypothetical protein
MLSVMISLISTFGGVVRSHTALHLEVLALRQQLQVLQRTKLPVATRSGGPLALGVARAVVDRLENGARYRKARDRPRLASSGIRLVLDMEESPPSWTTNRPEPPTSSDSDDVERKRAVGRTADSRRIIETRLPGFPVDGCQVHGPPDDTAVTGVAHILGKSSPANSRNRSQRQPAARSGSFRKCVACTIERTA